MKKLINLYVFITRKGTRKPKIQVSNVVLFDTPEKYLKSYRKQGVNSELRRLKAVYRSKLYIYLLKAVMDNEI